MSFESFTEKEIRDAILSKVNPQKINKKGKHWKGSIYIGNKLITKVKIPNSHQREFKSTKAQFLARALKLNEEEYSKLINCSMRGPEYYNLLESKS